VVNSEKIVKIESESDGKRMQFLCRMVFHSNCLRRLGFGTYY